MSTQSHISLFNTDSSRLRGFLRQAARADEPDCWTASDLAAVFKHQWAAPLGVDLSALEARAAERLKTVAEARGLVLNSFGDLFRHEHPPLALLEMSKDFAKRNIYSENRVLPRHVARVLYFLSIASALARCRVRISSLSDDELRTGLSWAASCDWIPDDARQILTRALDALARKEADA